MKTQSLKINGTIQNNGKYKTMLNCSSLDLYDQFSCFILLCHLPNPHTF